MRRLVFLNICHDFKTYGTLTSFARTMDPLVYVAASTVILILIVLLTFLRKSTKEGMYI